MSLFDVLRGHRKELTIHDLNVMVPKRHTPEEVKAVFVASILDAFKDEGIVMAHLDEQKDRLLAKSIGLTDAQYALMHEHWFGKWLKHTGEQR